MQEHEPASRAIYCVSMQLIQELKRRRVFKIAIAYILVGWALIEAAATLFPMFESPAWMPQAFTIIVFLGFPIAILLSWAVQVTDKGLVIDRSTIEPEEGKIRFVTAPDGVRLAYVLSGTGPPLVKTAHWLTHLEEDWGSPIWHHWLSFLADGRQLLRYDERGCGLSDRNTDDLSVDAFVMDLETVVDAVGLQRFPILGSSQGGPVSIAYAVKHPERVSALIIYGSFARGWTMRGDAQIVEQERAMVDLVRTGWGRENPAFRQMFASLFVPEADAEQFQSFVDMASVSTSPDTAADLLKSFGQMDVRDLLPQVRVPTLVIHARGDARIPASNGREIASGIPGAEFVTLEGNNHIILEAEPAFGEFKTVVNQFLERHS